MNTINSFENDDTLMMKKPTLEEYEKARKEYRTYFSWLQTAREKKNELIDVLANERKKELVYLKQVEKQLDIIRRYEIYERIEKGGE